MAFIALIILCLLFPHKLRADIIKAQYELTLYPEKKILQGNASFELDTEGPYDFFLGNLRVEGAKIGNETLKLTEDTKRGYLRIYNFKKNATFTLFFEGDFPIKSTPLPQIFENYIPFPQRPASMEVSLRTLGKLSYQLLLPYEEKEDKEGITLYRIKSPLPEPPPLILGLFKEKALNLRGREVFFYLPGDFSEKAWKDLETTLKKEMEKLQKPYPFPPYPKAFVFLAFEKKVLPLALFLPISTDKETLSKELLSGLVEQTLKYGLNLKKELLEGLKLYLGSYALSPDQRVFRKELLLRPSQEGQAFFQLFEWINSLGEEKFKNFLNFYMERYLFNGSVNELFWKSAFSYFKESPLTPVSSFQRVRLKINPELKFLTSENKYHLRLNVSQENTFRPLTLELYVITEQDKLFKTLSLNQRDAFFDLYLDKRPVEIVIDPAYKIYRELSFAELPLSLDLLRERELEIYLPQKELFPIYREFLEKFRKKGARLNYENIFFSALPPKNLLFLEVPPQGFHLPVPKEGIYFQILPHPASPEHFLAFVKISSLKEWRRFKSKEESLQNSEGFLFQNGKIIYNLKAKSRDGILVPLAEGEKLFGIRPAQMESLERFLPEWLGLQALLIGENHDRYEHHLFQLEVIKRLHHYFKNLAIGLEMVQSPFQKYLEDFIENKITEKELLERIEYFDRWRFDYHLYREIFLYAREHKLKLLALDVPQEIVKKVAKGGFSELTEEEKRILPELDLYNPSYKNFLKGVFESHRFDNSTNFEFFYQAQLLRDEGMAERIVEYLKKNPESKLIVLTGKGHLQSYYGIPQALKRRNFTHFKTILLGEVEEFKSSLADYWFNPPPVEYEKTLQLGLSLDETSEGLKVKEVLKDSLAEKSGLKAGDILLNAEERTLRKVSDLKLVLTFKEKGSELSLIYKREGEIKTAKIKIPEK
jgi:uncharacterized iron-regulated protein